MGSQEKAVFVTDTVGMTVALPVKVAWGKGHRGENAPYGNVKFPKNEGMLILDDPDIIQAFRQHSGNEENGGSDFKEMAATVANFSPGASVAMPEDGISDLDIANIRAMKEMCNRNISPKEREKTAKMVAAFAERFSLRGVKLPQPGEKPGRIQTRLFDIIELLEEKGIVIDDERGANTATG